MNKNNIVYYYWESTCSAGNIRCRDPREVVRIIRGSLKKYDRLLRVYRDESDLVLIYGKD
jgi:hypothetical protein